MKTLELLKEKLDLLVQKYSAVEAENKRLKQMVLENEAAIALLNKKLASSEPKGAGLNLGKIIVGNEENEAIRKQLDVLIDEIDKILITIND